MIPRAVSERLLVHHSLNRIEKLVLSNESSYEHAEDTQFANALVTNLRAALQQPASLACRLRSLRLEDLQLEAVPESLRSLTACEELNLSGWSLLHTLPEWLGELPLRKLMANNCYSLDADALPTSFSTLASLREIHVLYAGNIVGMDVGVDLSGAIAMDKVDFALQMMIFFYFKM